MTKKACSPIFSPLASEVLVKTDNVRLSSLINYQLKAKIQKIDKITGCALVPKAYIPNFSLLSPNLGQVCQATSEFEGAPAK